jgi:hypothetical protein
MNKLEIINSVYGDIEYTIDGLDKLIKVINLTIQETEKNLAQDDFPVGEIIMARFQEAGETEFSPIPTLYHTEISRLKRGDKLYLSKRYKIDVEGSK